jgi:hypothetical protein
MSIPVKIPKQFEIPVQDALKQMADDIMAVAAKITAQSTGEVADMLSNWYGGNWTAIKDEDAFTGSLRCSTRGGGVKYTDGLRSEFEIDTLHVHKCENAKVRRSASDMLVELGGSDVLNDISD